MERGPKFFIALIVAALAYSEAHAERLALRYLGPAEGLPHSRVRTVVEDDRGFLWFATPEGLGRFDGTVVRIYDKRAGLPVAGVNDLLVTRSGEYLVATAGAGVWRLEPEGSFSPVDMQDGLDTATVLTLHEDPDGRIWAGTLSGLFVLEGLSGASSFRIVPGPADPGQTGVLCFADDPDGSLWIGTISGLVRRTPDGRLLHTSFAGFGGPTRIRSLMLDDGRLWIGHEYGLMVFVPRSLDELTSESAADTIVEPDHVEIRDLEQVVKLPQRPGRAAAYTVGDNLNRRVVRRIVRAADGKIWIAQVGRGLIGFDGQRFSRYDRRHGFRDETLNDIHEDRSGGLWLASDAAGAMRVDWDGLVAYGPSEGLGHTFITALYGDSRDTLIAVAGDFAVNVFDGQRFDNVRRALPVGVEDPYFWDDNLLTRNGEWWLPTVHGLHRFAPPVEPLAIGAATPLAIYNRDDGLPGTGIGTMFEDRRGDLWLSVLDGDSPLARWERATDSFHAYSEHDGLPEGTITALAESPSGQLWLGFDDGRIAHRPNEARFLLLPSGTGTPRAAVRQLLFDSSGRLWIATDGAGLGRVNDPETGKLDGRTYSTEDGMASESVRCLVEDRFGRIYAGTGRGIHRLSPADHRVVRLAAPQALINDEIRVGLRDRHDDLWFGTLDGLSRLRPREDDNRVPPTVYVGAIRVEGSPGAVPELGAVEIEEIELPPGRNHLQVDYFALSLVPGDTLRYEYRLGGAGERWTSTDTLRSVTFANLAPGLYDFRVRATDSSGAVSPTPAGFRLVVRSPFWRTAWFGGVVLALVAVSGWTLHRNRMARALAIERVRMRIATDLHDDIGSNLTHVAILCEVTLRRLGESGSRAVKSLSRIAEVSRETIDTMSDIVWAINPERDRLGDLVLRMRRFTNDMAGGNPIRVSFSAPTAGLEKPLDSEARRQFYRVFKESLNNAVRHSGCTHLQIEVVSDQVGLRLRVRDDGRGFDPETITAGHGLDSMRSRAEALGGRLEIRTKSGEGTAITLELPRGRRR